MFIILFYFPFAKVVLIPYIYKNRGLRLVKSPNENNVCSNPSVL